MQEGSLRRHLRRGGRASSLRALMGLGKREVWLSRRRSGKAERQFEKDFRMGVGNESHNLYQKKAQGRC